MISNESPIGRALLDRRPGEEVEVLVPDGTIRLTVVSTT
jgi:transcription elongation GreA/GreB family factor